MKKKSAVRPAGSVPGWTPRRSRSSPMLHRRDAMIRLGQIGIGAIGLPQLLAAQTRPASTHAQSFGKARSCLLLYLWGGPSQPDMWDLKPDAPEGMRSIWKPVSTRVPGIALSEMLPHSATVLDKIAIIRSMSHESNNHEPSVYHTLTGRRNPVLAVPANARKRTDFPGVAAVVSAFAPAMDLPASVTIPQPVGHDGFNYAGTYAGFLGPRHDPMELRQSTPESNKSPGAHQVSIPQELDSTRLLARQGLLESLEQLDRRAQQNAGALGLDASRAQAYRLISSPAAKRAFDLNAEDPRLRDRYGRNEYADSFLLARRLIEAGVRLVTVTWMYFVPNSGRILNVWDTHGGTADLGNAGGFEMLKADYAIPPFDRAYSALIDDLSMRGLLDETLVVTTGEFGRTPKINGTRGREHWGMCYSALLAGGGIRGGQVHGSSDKLGAFPASDPVAPEDLLATIYHALGIDPTSEIFDRQNRPYPISTGTPLYGLFG